MKLSTKEFDAMQMGWRKWYIEKIELKTFEKFGLDLRNADILEVGCGNGYAASLLTARGVNSSDAARGFIFGSHCAIGCTGVRFSLATMASRMSQIKTCSGGVRQLHQ